MSESVDLPVVGGGINGAAIARDAAGRVVFMLPWLGRYRLIGTTDIPQAEPPEQAHCTNAERDYLLKETLPGGRLGTEQVLAGELVSPAHALAQEANAWLRTH